MVVISENEVDLIMLCRNTQKRVGGGVGEGEDWDWGLDLGAGEIGSGLDTNWPEGLVLGYVGIHKNELLFMGCLICPRMCNEDKSFFFGQSYTSRLP